MITPQHQSPFSILSQCDRVLKLQKRIISIVSMSKYNAHIEEIFKTLKLLKLNDILELQELKLYYKYKKKNISLLAKSTFQIIILVYPKAKPK